jgi:hypothetical protein
MQQYSEMTSTTSLMCLLHAKLRQSNGATDFQGKRDTLLINGARCFNPPQAMDEY